MTTFRTGLSASRAFKISLKYGNGAGTPSLEGFKTLLFLKNSTGDIFSGLFFVDIS
jgi:hypothetical protein